jgi:hypothetical protein
MPEQNRYHNLSNEQLADEIGKLHTKIKSLEDEIEPYKEEFKRRGCSAVRGALFVVTASETTQKRLDSKKLRADLGDALAPYDMEVSSTRILVKPSPNLAEVA